MPRCVVVSRRTDDFEAPERILLVRYHHVRLFRLRRDGIHPGLRDGILPLDLMARPPLPCFPDILGCFDHVVMLCDDR